METIPTVVLRMVCKVVNMSRMRINTNTSIRKREGTEIREPTHPNAWGPYTHLSAEWRHILSLIMLGSLNS